MVYISEIVNGSSIIHDGARMAESNSQLRTSSDLRDLDGCWEWTDLVMKLKETAALKKNAADALAHLGRSGGRLLDFGCGGGFFLAEAKDRGWEVYGLEPLPGHAVHARALTGGTIITDTLRDHTFPMAFFDCVTAFQVFEHLPDPSAEIGKLCRMLKPGGTILIEVPNIDTLGVKLLGRRHRHFVPDHLNFFSPTTLVQLASLAGLSEIKTYKPTRMMSLEYLTEHWGGRLLPARIASLAAQALAKLPARRRLLGLNVGDILAAVARKPE